MKTALVTLLASLVFILTAFGGIRGPGKYNGVVIFDRWGGCYLHSGVYLMAISEEAKESLRAYRGKPVLIDAQEVFQPMNPGDGLITKLMVLGPAQEPSGTQFKWLPDLEGVETAELQVSIALDKAGLHPRETYKLYRFTVQRYH